MKKKFTRSKNRSKKQKIINILCNGVIIIAILIMAYFLIGSLYSKILLKVDADDFKFTSFDQKSMVNEMNSQSENTDDEKSQETKTRLTEYEKPIGVIDIPKIKIEIPIFYNMDEYNLARGVTLMQKKDLRNGDSKDISSDDNIYSLNPEINNNIIITGHSGTDGVKNNEMFLNLDLLEEKDNIYIDNGKNILHYQINHTQTVLPSDTDALFNNLQSKKDQLVLITCVPYFINSHRLLVFSDLIEILPRDTAIDEEGINSLRLINPANLFALVIILVIIIGFVIKKLYDMKKNPKKIEEVDINQKK